MRIYRQRLNIQAAWAHNNIKRLDQMAVKWCLELLLRLLFACIAATFNTKFIWKWCFVYIYIRKPNEAKPTTMKVIFWVDPVYSKVQSSSTFCVGSEPLMWKVSNFITFTTIYVSRCTLPPRRENMSWTRLEQMFMLMSKQGVEQTGCAACGAACAVVSIVVHTFLHRKHYYYYYLR